MVNLKPATAAPIKQERPNIKPLLLTKDSFNDAELSAGRTTIVYGNSGDGKTTLLYDFARRTHAETGAHFRLITAEDSTKTIFAPLIREGVVEIILMTKITEPVTTLHRLARGEWLSLDDDSWKLWDYSAQYYLIEGLTSISELIQEDCREQGRFLGEQKENSVIENGERLSMASKFMYGFAQLETLRLVRSFGMIPRINRVIWTGHEVSAVDESTGEKIHGPALVGTAKTSSVQKYCGMLLHLDSEVPKSGPSVRKLWWAKHPDPLSPLYSCPAKVTIPIEALSKFTDAVNGRNHYEVTVRDGHLQGSLYDLFKAEQTAISAVEA